MLFNSCLRAVNKTTTQTFIPGDHDVADLRVVSLQQRRQLLACGVIGQDGLNAKEERDQRVTTVQIKLNVLNRDMIQRQLVGKDLPHHS
ncbi:MAG: hypothetical protein OXF84_12040 [Bacteroidetes bacterium]|nr:hypothetical protein [Bacteroidota bacterium]